MLNGVWMENKLVTNEDHGDYEERWQLNLDLKKQDCPKK